MSSDAVSSFPFLTITKNLTTNRCWLCEQTFPRGLTKRVFQIQNLLDYFKKRYELEKSSTSSGDMDTTTEGAISESDKIPPIRTKNLADCYARYKADMDSFENIDALLKEMRENDLDVWMSGLICALHGGCASDSSLFIEGYSNSAGTLSTATKAKPGIPIGITFANKDCPPNCGCDNPWAFLS